MILFPSGLKSREQPQAQINSIHDEKAKIQVNDGTYLGRFRYVDLQHVDQMVENVLYFVTEHMLYIYTVRPTLQIIQGK